MNILPTIAQEVVSQCRRQSTDLPLHLATLYVRTQLVLAKKDAQDNVELATDAIEQLVTGCVRNLMDLGGPTSAKWHTLLLQSTVAQAQTEHLNHARTERVQKKAKAHRLAQEVVSKRNDVFSTIVLNIIHEAHPDKMTDEMVQRSVSIALDAVFPRSLMDAFVSQSDAEKSRQLHEMTFIVVGMRLFQFASGKDVPGIQDYITDARALLNSVVGAALQLDMVVGKQITQYENVLSAPALKLTDGERHAIHDEHLGRLQLRLYTRSLLRTVRDVTNRLDEAAALWQQLVADTTALFHNGAAGAAAAAGNNQDENSGAAGSASTLVGSAAQDIPKSAVYPKWLALADHWEKLSALHNEAEEAASMLRVVMEFEAVPGAPAPALKPQYVDQAQQSLATPGGASAAVISAQQREALAKEITDNYPAVEYIPSLSAEKRENRLEFNGFCLPTFVETGLVTEGATDEKASPGFLLVRANSAYYAFSSVRSLRSFAKDPYRYLSPTLMTSIAGDPPLIYLLGLHAYLPREVYRYGSRKVHSRDAGDNELVAVKAEATTQTGHIPAFKDTHYVWDEWELRRLALQLASLRTKRTKSTQTALSHFRRDNDTQVFLPKEQSTQTLVDAATQPPRVVRYLAGLRGTESSQIRVVEKSFQY